MVAIPLISVYIFTPVFTQLSLSAHSIFVNVWGDENFCYQQVISNTKDSRRINTKESSMHTHQTWDVYWWSTIYFFNLSSSFHLSTPCMIQRFLWFIQQQLNIKWILSEYWGKIAVILSKYWWNIDGILGIFSEYWWNIEGILSEYCVKHVN